MTSTISTPTLITKLFFESLETKGGPLEENHCSKETAREKLSSLIAVKSLFRAEIIFPPRPTILATYVLFIISSAYFISLSPLFLYDKLSEVLSVLSPSPLFILCGDLNFPMLWWLTSAGQPFLLYSSSQSSSVCQFLLPTLFYPLSWTLMLSSNLTFLGIT